MLNSITPFQQALIAGTVLAITFSFLGVFVTIRRMSFFSDGIAHASLAGIAIGLLTHVNPLWTALLVGVVFAVLLFALEKKTTISPDAGIGILFTAGMALGIVLISKGGLNSESLEDILFGNILAASSQTLTLIAALGVVIVALLLWFSKQLTLLIMDRDEAWLVGMRTNILELFFYIILAVSVILGAKLLGILLVSALLIIPPTTARLFAHSFKQFVAGSIVWGVITVLGGLALSSAFTIPPGALIILTGAGLFLVVFSLHTIARKT